MRGVIREKTSQEDAIPMIAKIEYFDPHDADLTSERELPIYHHDKLASEIRRLQQQGMKIQFIHLYAP